MGSRRVPAGRSGRHWSRGTAGGSRGSEAPAAGFDPPGVNRTRLAGVAAFVGRVFHRPNPSAHPVDGMWKERVTHVGAHPAPRASRLRRTVVTATGMAVAGAFIAFSGAATAAPSPTTNQVKQKISKLMSQLDAVAQQYDQSISELNSANARLAQMAAFIGAAKTLRQSQEAQQRTTTAITQIKKKKAAQRQHLRELLTKNQAELRKLTAPPPSATVSSGGGGLTYSGPATGAARVAVQNALSKIGFPYVWGGTGPNGFDCSGLVMAAWAAAGVQIPRTTYEQWAALPHVPSSSIQPGDLLFYDAEGHVAIYVGGGKIVDAPEPGMNVEEIPMSSSWYAATFDGAARP